MKRYLHTMIAIGSTVALTAWEEDPRIEDHNKRTDYLIKLGNKQLKEKNEETINLLTYIHQERMENNEEGEQDE